MTSKTDNVKFIIWRSVGSHMQLEYTDCFYLNITYETETTPKYALNAIMYVLKHKFIDKFYEDYGIKLLPSNIIVNGEYNKPSPQKFIINEIYIEESESKKLFNNIRKKKLQSIINGNTRT